MDDLEFRKHATIQPGEQSREFLDKKNQSRTNQRFVEQQLAFENTLLETLEIDPPDTLAERIILAQQLSQHQQQRRHRRNWLFTGIAASLGAMVVSFSLILPRSIDVQQLGQQVIGHIIQDTHALNVQMDVPKSSIDTMLASYGGKLDGPIGQVSFLGHCIIGRHTGIHMVLNSSKGKVSVLLLPSQAIDHDFSLKNRTFVGLLYPSKKGSIAIVANHPESVAQTRQRLERNLHWII